MAFLLQQYYIDVVNIVQLSNECKFKILRTYKCLRTVDGLVAKA